ncbi:MAG: polysaccharide biosynthesis/export family protein [Magnetococcales bacterium]|nr:polysaccharide biosynthesis/export family protein [Magnetococcales bacterium]
MGRLFPLVTVLCGLPMVSACVSSREEAPTNGEVVMDHHAFSFAKPEFTSFAEYRISPGDILDVLFHIKTWMVGQDFHISQEDTLEFRFPGAKELNETQRVRPDGKISLPYLGEMEVRGKTVAELRQELEERYKGILRNPNVIITVPEFLQQIREMKKDLYTSSRGLSRLVTVRPDGQVTFPMIGHVFVAGRTINEVNEDINRKYAAIHESLHIDLFLEKHAGSLIYVLGEVASSGAYKIDKPVSVAQAVVLAGGMTKDARGNQVIVIRRKEDKMVGTAIALQDALELKPGASFFQIMPDDIIYVPPHPVTTAAHLAQQIGNMLMFRGFSLGMSYELRRLNQGDRVF